MSNCVLCYQLAARHIIYKKLYRHIDIWFVYFTVDCFTVYLHFLSPIFSNPNSHLNIFIRPIHDVFTCGSIMHSNN